MNAPLQTPPVCVQRDTLLLTAPDQISRRCMRHAARLCLIGHRMRDQDVEAPPPDVPPLLALVMMVKNEADFINQTLASVKPHIDSWTIVDTGEYGNTVLIG